MLADVGVDAVGLNFFERSKRYVDDAAASKIVACLPRGVLRVGVFVNASSDTIRQTAQAHSLDVIQLHGDEPPEFLDQLSEFRILRAFRCESSLSPVNDYLNQCKTLPEAMLVDAYDPQEYGGTGKTLNWPDVAKAEEFSQGLPVILAGGLAPENIAEAIRMAQPQGVDVASGVEVSGQPRRKDREQCEAFVKAAKAAFST